MKQSKLHSFIESVTQTVVAFLLAVYVVQPLVFEYEMGIQVDTGTSMRVAIVFTLVSLVRSYFVRRAFNEWHHR